MTGTPESRTEPIVAATERRPNRLNQIAAWVGIVAGVVFIVAAIFFSGFALGKHSGGYFGRDHRGDEFGMYRDGGPRMGPGQMGPGQTGPGGMMGPGQRQSPTPTPAVPNSPRP
ncbi:hypothetical protein BH09ACT7_BH09ACT7_28470 [soil metagenome]